MIVKSGNQWLVKDSSGKKILGKHSSKEKAAKQLAAIEISKKERNLKEFNQNINISMHPLDNYYKIKCAQLYEEKKKLLKQLKLLDEEINMATTGQGQQVPPAQQVQQRTAIKGKRKVGEKDEEQVQQDQNMPTPMHGIAATPQMQAARALMVQRYSDNPMTPNVEQPGKINWQNVNASVGNERQEALRRLMMQQRMV